MPAQEGAYGSLVKWTLRLPKAPRVLPLASVPEITMSKEALGPAPHRFATQVVVEQVQTSFILHRDTFPKSRFVIF
jgi:hypothetical protein